MQTSAVHNILVAGWTTAGGHRASKAKSCAPMPPRRTQMALRYTWYASIMTRGCQGKGRAVQAPSRHLVMREVTRQYSRRLWLVCRTMLWCFCALACPKPIHSSSSMLVKRQTTHETTMSDGEAQIRTANRAEYDSSWLLSSASPVVRNGGTYLLELTI